MTAERLLIVEQAAELLGLTPFTVRAWLRSGKLRGVKTSAAMQGQWRVPESAINELVATLPSRMTTPTNPE